MAGELMALAASGLELPTRARKVGEFRILLKIQPALSECILADKIPNASSSN